MRIQDLSTYIRQRGKQIEELIRHQMPVKAGQIAVSHFKQNFRESGFVDNGLHPWRPAQRIGTAKGAAGRRKTLTSGRNHLMSSIYSKPGDASVTVYNPVEYAGIHNEGGTLNVHPTVTKKMKKFAWARYYEALGLKKGEKPPASIPEDAARWRRLALTKKPKLDIKIDMPQRRFIGDSRELTSKLNAKLEQELENILFK